MDFDETCCVHEAIEGCLVCMFEFPAIISTDTVAMRTTFLETTPASYNAWF
jgi:hypothetical protein